MTGVRCTMWDTDVGHDVGRVGHERTLCPFGPDVCPFAGVAAPVGARHCAGKLAIKIKQETPVPC